MCAPARGAPRARAIAPWPGASRPRRGSTPSNSRTTERHAAPRRAEPTTRPQRPTRGHSARASAPAPPGLPPPTAPGGAPPPTRRHPMNAPSDDVSSLRCFAIITPGLRSRRAPPTAVGAPLRRSRRSLTSKVIRYECACMLFFVVFARGWIGKFFRMCERFDFARPRDDLSFELCRFGTGVLN